MNSLEVDKTDPLQGPSVKHGEEILGQRQELARLIGRLLAQHWLQEQRRLPQRKATNKSTAK